MVFFYGLLFLLASHCLGATLPEILKNTLNNNAQIQEAVEHVEVARAQLEQARAALFPRASAMLLMAPIFEERGDAIISRSNTSKWGPFVKGSVEVVQPLYSFGQISGYNTAAESQLTAFTELAHMKKAEILYQTKEIYFGFLMAGELESLVNDLIEYLEEAVETADRNSKKKSSTVKPHDLYKLKTALDDLYQKRLLATASKKTAEEALHWLSRLPRDKIVSAPLEPLNYQKKPLEAYTSVALKMRPELKALVAGLSARSALRDAKSAAQYPVVFLGGLLSYGWSPVRERQRSIFANDPFNRFEGGLGVGLKFDLEFKKNESLAEEQNAEVMKLKAQERYAIPGIELQVKKAFYELEQAEKGLEVATRRKATAKKWFVSNAMGWSIGVTPPKDLLESLEGDGLAKKNYIETLYALNLSLARLSQAVGEEQSSDLIPSP